MSKTKTILFLLVISSSVSTLFAQCDRVRDSLTLVEFYHATGGDDWTYPQTTFSHFISTILVPNEQVVWDFNTSFDKWHGIEVDSNGCVETLLLYDNNLIGEIPDFLANLTQLKLLNLSHNNLTGSIPESLVDLENLTEFHLESNELSGCIPDSIYFSNFILWGTPRIGEGGFNFRNNDKLPWYGESQLIYAFKDLGQIGAICYSGDPKSYNNEIQEDCSCRGEYCHSSDSLMLLKLFTATNGKNWSYDRKNYGSTEIPNAGQKWSSDIPISQWHGVEVANHGCVTSIYLNDNNLDSIIPELNFPLIRNFVVSNNKISGALPNLDSLPSLNYFDCSNNQMSGSFTPMGPNHINHFNCSNNQFSGELIDSLLPIISHFYCSDNQFTGNLPSSETLFTLVCKNNQFSGEIPNTYNIETLDCSNNQLTGGIPAFSNSPELRYLDCSNNQLNDTVSLRDKKGLRFFYCQHNQLKGNLDEINFPIGFKALNCSNNKFRGDIPILQLASSTREFDCSNNQFEGGLPAVFFTNQLEKFDCSNNNIKGTFPQFKIVKGLTEFDCSNNLISGILPELEKGEDLQIFNCSNNKITGRILPIVNNIQSFNCSNNELTGRIPNLKTAKELKEFNCSHNLLKGNIPSLDSLANLKIFDCGSNNLTDQIPKLSNLPNLEKFFCQENYYLNGSIPKLDQVPHLTHFNCSSNQLSGEIPDLSKVPLLRSFIFNNNFLSGTLSSSIGALDSIEKFYGYYNQLEGCYPFNLDNLCNIGYSENTDSIGYNLIFNPLLPWQGDLQPFCDKNSQFGEACDDGNPNTVNDIIQADCSCAGTISTSVSNLESIDFYLYPNPTTGILYLQKKEIKQLSLFNSIGKKVALDFQIGRSAIDLKELKTGIYILRIEDRENVFLKKVIKK